MIDYVSSPLTVPTSLSSETVRLAVRLEAKLRLLQRFSQPTKSNYAVTMPREVPAENDSSTNSGNAAKYNATESRSILELLSDLASRHRNGQLTELSAETLFELHKRLLQDSSEQNGIQAGKFRETPVAVGDAFGAEAKDIPTQVDALLEWARWPGTEPLPRLPRASGIIKAVAVHAQLLIIHPFSDGNGRVARALEFAMLLAAGVPITAAHLPHNFYNEDRSAYNHAMRQSRAKSIDEFVRYALQGFLVQVQRQLEQSLGNESFSRRQLLRVGFTLVELVVVILILGILAGVATPKILDAAAKATEAASDEQVRNILDGIEHYYLDRLSQGSPRFPGELDDASFTVCDVSNPCFGNVLRRAITDGKWKKITNIQYVSPAGKTYEYDEDDGSFDEV